ncbi:MAG: hypothetical protein RL122_1638 [Pseudomonadota bacterium]|uniref:Uncharacterized protein n=1 Tax=Thiothrix fructosivorans TaxID=111770 RepID=A0A8B0SIC7_9GAMM|nr:hypothetical protein [Thiothrix fructosivorans]MBO0613464.1 hypothetical protein [Thiothrix fructosivorans]QTX11106.1 hypothetical protein J1836_001695 [Thiothrix fructosivorans]
MATIRYAIQGGRREQMKRELIGLVIGTTLLMAGMAFLFSQTLVADNSSSDAAVTAAVATPPVAAKADIPALAALDVASNNATVNPVNAPAPVVVSTPAAVLTPPEPAVTPPAVLPTSPAVEAVATVETPKADETTSGTTGWIYGGQFANGKWLEQGLKIGAELPVAGNKYPLSWGATVREHPPGKRSEGGGKLGKTLGNLATGHEVEIVQVKKSGSKGHVWLEIKYQ